jgi:hypothetical protein
MSARLDDTLDCENSSSLLNAQVPGKISEQIERLLAHQLFQHSDSNRQLVAYLGKRAIDHPGQPVKEIELAREVFGLSPDKFDPQVDSTVRVRIGRLRTKLLEYYASAGIDDEVLLEIPKGSYCLISHFRTKEPTAHVHSEPPPAELPSIPYAIMETAPASTKSKTQGRMILILVLALGALLGAVATHLIERQRSKRMPAHLDQFWTSFYNAQQPLTIVYSCGPMACIMPIREKRLVLTYLLI